MKKTYADITNKKRGTNEPNIQQQEKQTTTATQSYINEQINVTKTEMKQEIQKMQENFNKITNQLTQDNRKLTNTIEKQKSEINKLKEQN